jgi:hypothetical protein
MREEIMDEEEVRGAGEGFTAKSVSRRSVLKTIGVGTAVAWAAPMIKSVPAFAAGRAPGSPPPLCSNCHAFLCSDPTGNGGEPVCGTDWAGDCVCVSRAQDGGCLCTDGGYCVPNGSICGTDSDCAPYPGSQCLQLVPPGPGCGPCGLATSLCGFPCGSPPRTQPRGPRSRFVAVG